MVLMVKLVSHQTVQGTIKLDGVELDNSAIATGYVLKATSATAAGWAAESGGGGSSYNQAINPSFISNISYFSR